MNQSVNPAIEAAPSESPDLGWLDALRSHWPEYLIEAAGLGIFMISACTFSVLLEHPMSAVNQTIDSSFVRRAIGGVAMGLTAIGIITSPWGKRSGAHMNPSITLSFFFLGKIQPWDALYYVLFQFLGAVAGVGLAGILLGGPLSHAAVNFAATAPGPGGPCVAFGAEIAISTLMMWTVLNVSNSARFSHYTPVIAGALVASFITIEAPLSGMSMNPARTFGSAFSANDWTALWVYFTAPPIGMLIAASLYRYRRGLHRVFCAKLDHSDSQRCIFRCKYGELHG